jgi:hypothetical protein
VSKSSHWLGMKVMSKVSLFIITSDEVRKGTIIMCHVICIVGKLKTCIHCSNSLHKLLELPWEVLSPINKHFHF